ncbi:MAG: hypothetical protein FJW14_01200 [Acidimicrobiia bacterium]|nr:hypothetical protein [Acidimicrobiia bacterium]
MAKTRFTSVDAYIAAKPRDVRGILEGVRRAIRKAVPRAEERLSYQIPSYTLDGVPVLYFAGWKAHYALYPVNDALVAAFRRELAPYERSKSSIRFPLSKPVPTTLIGRIARFRADVLTGREKGAGARSKGRQAQLERVRRLCAAMPSVTEKLSHGTPTFFVEKDKGVFAMFADHHHDDGRLALWVPVPNGLQPFLIEDAPRTYFKPPYMGASGWVGIMLGAIRDDALRIHIRDAWQLVAGRKKRTVRTRTRS